MHADKWSDRSKDAQPEIMLIRPCKQAEVAERGKRAATGYKSEKKCEASAVRQLEKCVEKNKNKKQQRGCPGL